MKDKIICLQRAGGARVFATEAQRMAADGIPLPAAPAKKKSEPKEPVADPKTTEGKI